MRRSRCENGRPEEEVEKGFSILTNRGITKKEISVYIPRVPNWDKRQSRRESTLSSFLRVDFLLLFLLSKSGTFGMYINTSLEVPIHTRLILCLRITIVLPLDREWIADSLVSTYSMHEDSEAQYKLSVSGARNTQLVLLPKTPTPDSL